MGTLAWSLPPWNSLIFISTAKLQVWTMTHLAYQLSLLKLSDFSLPKPYLTFRTKSDRHPVLCSSLSDRTNNRSAGTDFITELQSIKDHRSISSHKSITPKEMSAKDSYLYEPQDTKFKRTIKTSKNSSLKMIQTSQWTKCSSDVPYPPQHKHKVDGNDDNKPGFENRIQ